MVGSCGCVPLIPCLRPQTHAEVEHDEHYHESQSLQDLEDAFLSFVGCEFDSVFTALLSTYHSYRCLQVW
jgi:hypothetical protein